MSVIRVKTLREETYTIRELRDIEDLVINTMGEDVWCEIMYFTEKKIEELQEEIEDLKGEIEDLKGETNSYDNTSYALRTGISDEIEVMQNLVSSINQAKRLDRKSIVKVLERIVERLRNNEGY